MRDAERKRLIELVEQGDKAFADKYTGEVMSHIDELYEFIADHLLENGAIVPPCKVGNTLYFLYNRPYANRPDLEPRIYETNNWYFDIDKNGVSILTRSIHGYNGGYHYYLGKTVFLTKEEAEQALRKEDEGK